MSPVSRDGPGAGLLVRDDPRRADAAAPLLPDDDARPEDAPFFDCCAMTRPRYQWGVPRTRHPLDVQSACTPSTRPLASTRTNSRPPFEFSTVTSMITSPLLAP